MKTKGYKQKVSFISILGFVLPVVPLLITAYFTFMALTAKSLGDSWSMLYIAATLVSTLAVAGPLCGGSGMLCSILSLRKTKKKRYIAAIIFNGLILLASIPMVVAQFAAL